MTKRTTRIGLAVALTATLFVGSFVALRTTATVHRTHVTAYFASSNGIYAGDEVRILGIPVGKIDRIEPQQQRAKISFWYDDKYPVPANANAVIISPSLVAVRAIQLTPAYTQGPAMQNGAVIPLERTAVPVEWDDLRAQLQKLTEMLQPTQPGGVSTLGVAVNTAAENLRGEGPNIRDTLIKLSQAFSALGDHSTDLFSTVKNVSTLVSALQDSKDVLRQLNQNLAAVTALLSDDPNEISNAVSAINDVVDHLKTFVAENRDAMGTTSDKLASVTTALNQSLDDVKQTLHILPNVLQNFTNIYQPAQGALTGVLALNNFANPLTFLCGAIQAASRLGGKDAAKLCVQYLAPIIKNRQYNFLPLGENLFVGAAARPNELTYSEDWLRPDYVPPSGSAAAPHPAGPAASVGERTAAEAPEPTQVAPAPTKPADGLQGMMLPPGGGT
ncbi:MCE family protein [Mycobacterium branderi]|uniref:Mammalian cell entry protein n=1 Tax=Mycobacterium branderi TaxID=43348 RepID=A0A7I7WEH5_9MYCO|nr:MCE family protein [Mycobacterium branderi]MCV7236330.1 MCE family protein [Mycobacterium branderi]ORA35495.1 mammalian cell entry protein [Mycobacterium branderi]BBZ15215.1 Mce family protein Mce3D [Mycobacterium branderi]